MSKPFYVGSATGKALRPIIALILLIVAGRTFNASGQTVTNLHSFGSTPNDGLFPSGGLVQGSDGNFYGVTGRAVFRISPNGSYTNLYYFGSVPNDGYAPVAGLVQGSDDNFYGMTSNGGIGNSGTVFRVSPSGVYTTLHSFALSDSNDGLSPSGVLVRGSDGNLYGTTGSGGTNHNGTVFRISPSGSYTNLYYFSGYSNDGAAPQAGLVQGSDGNFYGTTYFGGTGTNCFAGCGTVFRISPSGSETILYSFTGSPSDGYKPLGLVQGSDGNFYGTTAGNGTSTNGTVFRISPSGSYTNLHSFARSPNDGYNPTGALIQGSDGNFYGTTDGGGTNNNGTIFRISPSGSHTNLYAFGSALNDGLFPSGGLVQGSDGNFYGMTFNGGILNSGTVYRLTIPLSPPPYPINQITGIQFFSIFDSTAVAVLIPSVGDEKYQLQYSDSLSSVNWINTGGTITSIGGPLILIDIAEQLPPQRFYRAVVTP